MIFFDILSTACVLFSIYMIASLSGLFAERSGTINLSINGGMIIGAMSYFLMARGMLYDPNVPEYMQLELTIPVLLSSVLIGMIGGMLITSLLSFAAINLKGDQVVVGTAINILAPVISLIAMYAATQEDHLKAPWYRILPVFGSQTDMPTYMIALIIAFIILGIALLAWLLLNKTRFGLRIRAAGENPNALAAAGVSVLTVRHMAMLISGALAGLAGALAAALAPSLSTYYNNVSGMGFIALAILIMGQWRTIWMIIGALAISFLFATMEQYGVTLGNQQFLLKMVPYLGTVAILPLVSKWSKAPKAVGVPYDKAQR